MRLTPIALPTNSSTTRQPIRFGARPAQDPLDTLQTLQLQQAEIRVKERFKQAKVLLEQIADIITRQFSHTAEQRTELLRQKNDPSTGWWSRVRLGWKLNTLDGYDNNHVALTALSPSGQKDHEFMTSLQILHDGGFAQIHETIYSNDRRSWTEPTSVTLTTYGKEYLKNSNEASST